MVADVVLLGKSHLVLAHVSVFQEISEHHDMSNNCYQVIFEL
jgi:hypothetical protein